MSRKNQPKQVEEVVEIKEEKIETPVASEETEAPVAEEKPSEEEKKDETTETPEDVKEPEKEEIKEEKIDPRIATMIALNRKQRISEKDKQTKIYSAMANIKIVRS